MSHRIPPKPPHFDTAPLGTCRWCNVEIGATKTGKVSKARWHASCVREYKLLFWPTKTRQAVWKRDLGRCAKCHAICARKGTPKWHMDHIVPLYSNPGNIELFKMDNLQTMCVPCHNAKSSLEAKSRAENRRLEKEKNKANDNKTDLD